VEALSREKINIYRFLKKSCLAPQDAKWRIRVILNFHKNGLFNIKNRIFKNLLRDGKFFEKPPLFLRQKEQFR